MHRCPGSPRCPRTGWSNRHSARSRTLDRRCRGHSPRRWCTSREEQIWRAGEGTGGAGAKHTRASDTAAPAPSSEPQSGSLLHGRLGVAAWPAESVTGPPAQPPLPARRSTRPRQLAAPPQQEPAPLVVVMGQHAPARDCSLQEYAAPQAGAVLGLLGARLQPRAGTNSVPPGHRSPLTPPRWRRGRSGACSGLRPPTPLPASSGPARRPCPRGRARGAGDQVDRRAMIPGRRRHPRTRRRDVPAETARARASNRCSSHDHRSLPPELTSGCQAPSSLSSGAGEQRAVCGCRSIIRT